MRLKTEIFFARVSEAGWSGHGHVSFQGELELGFPCLSRRREKDPEGTPHLSFYPTRSVPPFWLSASLSASRCATHLMQCCHQQRPSLASGPTQPGCLQDAMARHEEEGGVRLMRGILIIQHCDFAMQGRDYVCMLMPTTLRIRFQFFQLALVRPRGVSDAFRESSSRTLFLQQLAAEWQRSRTTRRKLCVRLTKVYLRPPLSDVSL